MPFLRAGWLLVAHLFRQTNPPPPAPPLPVTLVLTNLPSPTAAVKLNFYDSAASFLRPGQAAQHATVLPPQRTARLQVSLAPGSWAIALAQDTNGNVRMDRNWLGIPTEPYAFSNDVRPRFKALGFAECAVRVTTAGQVITILFPD